MSSIHSTEHIDYTEDGEGLYTARCTSSGLTVTGATLAEAEAAIMSLLEERSVQLGQTPGAVVSSERDTRLEPDES